MYPTLHSKTYRRIRSVFIITRTDSAVLVFFNVFGYASLISAI